MTAIRGFSVDVLGEGVPGQEPAREYQELHALEQAKGPALQTGNLTRYYTLEKKRQDLAEKLKVPKYKAGDIIEHRTGERAVVTGTTFTDSDSGSPRLIYRILRGPQGEVHDMWHAESVVRKVPKSTIVGAFRPKKETREESYRQQQAQRGARSRDLLQRLEERATREGSGSIYAEMAAETRAQIAGAVPSLPPGTRRG
jgi:hypothetical protein